MRQTRKIAADPEPTGLIILPSSTDLLTQLDLTPVPPIISAFADVGSYPSRRARGGGGGGEEAFAFRGSLSSRTPWPHRRPDE